MIKRKNSQVYVTEIVLNFLAHYRILYEKFGALKKYYCSQCARKYI